MDESGGASSWRSNPFVHHQKIRLVDFWGFNEVLYLGKFCRRKKQRKKTKQSLGSSLRLIFPDVQRLPLIPGKVILVDITQQTEQYHYTWRKLCFCKYAISSCGGHKITISHIMKIFAYLRQYQHDGRKIRKQKVNFVPQMMKVFFFAHVDKTFSHSF